MQSKYDTSSFGTQGPRLGPSPSCPNIIAASSFAHERFFEASPKLLFIYLKLLRGFFECSLNKKEIYFGVFFEAPLALTLYEDEDLPALRASPPLALSFHPP